MLTIADALKLNELKDAELVAGAGGVHRPIAWVHNPGVPDAHNWLNGGEFVLTTSLNIPDTIPEQVRYIQALADKDVAGLGVAVGRFLSRIPDEWREVANLNDFPLVAVPSQVRFIDVARTINERISQEGLTQVRRALHIHQVLTQLVLNDGDLSELARVLANLIGQSISIETERFDALANANIAAIDEARRYTVEHGRTNPLLIQTLEDKGILAQVRQTLRPVQLPQMPAVGLELERILAPVVVHGDIYGYMWIIADGSPLTELDRMALESGATVAALMMLHQEAVQTAEASLKGNLLSQLIEGEEERETVLTDQALRFGIDLNRPYRMLVLDPPTAYMNGAGVRAYRRVNRLTTEQGWSAVVGQFAGQVILLLDDNTNAAKAAEHVHDWLAQANLRVGVSGVHHAPGEVPRAHRECIEALTIARRLGHGQPVVQFDELGYIYALYCAGGKSLEGNPHVPVLQRLQAETQADLFHTLEVYLDQGGNGVATADALHIHRSTLNYRLQRIEQITSANLADPTTRLNLQITLKQMRLFDLDS